jgi:hypothetical protein
MKQDDLRNLYYLEPQRQSLIQNEEQILLFNRRAASALRRLRVTAPASSETILLLRYCAHQIGRLIRSCERILARAGHQELETILIVYGCTEDETAVEKEDCSDPDPEIWPEQDDLCNRLTLDVSRLAKELRRVEESVYRLRTDKVKRLGTFFAAVRAVQRAVDLQEIYLSRWTVRRSPEIVLEYNLGEGDEELTKNREEVQ